MTVGLALPTVRTEGPAAGRGVAPAPATPPRSPALVAAPVTVRRARPADADAIAALIAPFAAAGVMLPKTPAELRASADRYLVAVRRGRIVGSAGLRPVSADTAEVVAVAVSPHLQGSGIGKRLVGAILERADEAGFRRVFAMTLTPPFFLRLGFREGAVTEVPEKLRLDCAGCARRAGCRELLMMRENDPGR